MYIYYYLASAKRSCKIYALCVVWAIIYKL